MDTEHYDEAINTIAHNLPSDDVEVEQVVKTTEVVVKSVKSRMNTTIGELRRERGHKIYALYKQYPDLAKMTKSRTLKDNQKRAKIWNIIMREINDEFGDLIDILSLENTKKLADYWKQRLEPPPPTVTLSDSVSLLRTLFPQIPDLLTPPNTPSPTVIRELGKEHIEALLVELKSAETERRGAIVDHRLRYLVFSTWQYLKVNGLVNDSRSRSNEANLRRRQMWQELTENINQKFNGSLAPLQVAQVKKSFSNYKRRHKPDYDWTYTGQEHPDLVKCRKKVVEKEEEILGLKFLILKGRFFYNQIPEEQQLLELAKFWAENWKH